MIRALALSVLVRVGDVQAQSVPTGPTCVEFGTEMTDTEAVGNLVRKVWSTSHAGCCSVCDEVNCEGFTFHLDQCYLFKDISGTQSKIDSFTRVKGSSCTDFGLQMVDTEIVGTLVRKVWSPSSARCCAVCDEMECEGYTFHFDQCYLMKDLTGVQRKENSLAHVKGSSCTGFEQEMVNTEMAGTLVGKVWSPDSSRCCTLCEEADVCEGYTFYLDQCYLMKDLTGTHGKQESVARVKGSTCPGFEEEMVDMELVGTSLAKVWSPYGSRCCTLCEEAAGCEGYTFHLDQCYLMKDLKGAQAKLGAFARVKGSTCSGFEKEMVDTEVVGALLAKVWSPDASRCCTLCEEADSCEGYNFHLDQCYLMKDLSGTNSRLEVFSRVKVLQCTGFEDEMPDTEVAGTLLAKVWSPSALRCCMLCEKARGCEGYTFHLDQCYLKKDLTHSFHKPDVSSRLKHQGRRLEDLGESDAGFLAWA